MEFVVLSRPKAKALSYKQDIKDCAIISITDVGTRENVFNHNTHIKGICKLQFDDVEAGDLNAITEEDANKIVNFLNSVKDRVDMIVVHCEAGVSRSAGVCAAAMTILGHDDMQIFDNPKFCPNMSCYRAVLTAAGKELDEKVIEAKEHHNLYLWCKENDIEPNFDHEIE